MTKVKKTKSKKDTKLYMLECISMHKIRYCIEADQETIDNITENSNEEGWDWDQFNDLIEFSQDHAGERVIAIQPIPDKETYLKMFDRDNAYLSMWADDKKFEFINKKFKK